MMKFSTLALACAGAFVLVGCATTTETPHVYSTVVNGHNSPMTIEAGFTKDGIASIDVKNEHETIGVGKVALKKMKAKILKYQSTKVDGITGATISSSAMVVGMNQLIQKAQANHYAQKVNLQKEPQLTGDETLHAQVVIVGGGGAGLTAAVSAYQAGAKKVIVLEKLGYLGGSTNVSEGALNAVDPVRQGKQGIEDSKEKFAEQTFNGGHKKGDRVLIKKLTDHSMESVEWLESLGVKFRDKVGTATGALWQRSHYPATPSGNTYIRALEKTIEDTHGAIEVITDANVKDLIVNKGVVVGVKAQNKKRQLTVMASDAVIIATGGFGANVKLRQEVNTGIWKAAKLDQNIGCTNIRKAAQGDGMMLAKKVGAQLVGLADIQIHPCGTPGTGLMENIRTSGRNRLFINTDGNRFVNEGAARDVLARAIFAQKGGTYYVLVNHLRYPSRNFVDRNGASIANMAALGSIVEANTLDELAAKTGMNAANLKKAVAEYNAVVEGKKKDRFEFVANNKDDKPMTEGPWYACKKVPTVHHTMGGIRINDRAQVLDAKGHPIAHLYAAGEVTGGIHGENRLGGNAIADVMVFGREAGKQSVKH